MIDYIPYKEHKREVKISSLSNRLFNQRIDNWKNYEDVDSTDSVFDEDVYPKEIGPRDRLMGRRYE